MSWDCYRVVCQKGTFLGPVFSWSIQGYCRNMCNMCNMVHMCNMANMVNMVHMVHMVNVVNMAGFEEEDPLSMKTWRGSFQVKENTPNPILRWLHTNVHLIMNIIFILFYHASLTLLLCVCFSATQLNKQTVKAKSKALTFRSISLAGSGLAAQTPLGRGGQNGWYRWPHNPLGHEILLTWSPTRRKGEK